MVRIGKVTRLEIIYESGLVKYVLDDSAQKLAALCEDIMFEAGPHPLGKGWRYESRNAQSEETGDGQVARNCSDFADSNNTTSKG